MNNSRINKEYLVNTLRDITAQIQEQENPVELDEYRRIFKKNVSIFKRAYVAAYMLKYFRHRPRRHVNSLNADMVSLFMSIGRSRRVSPSDIIRLITDKTDAQREDVGIIKILDNYSFIDVNTEHAEKIIENLNDIEFHGKSINVNYAKKRN
ncbi:MAG: DbpA RNA binding domain-containing protein [Salinispira sp.]